MAYPLWSSLSHWVSQRVLAGASSLCLLLSGLLGCWATSGPGGLSPLTSPSSVVTEVCLPPQADQPSGHWFLDFPARLDIPGRWDPGSPKRGSKQARNRGAWKNDRGRTYRERPPAPASPLPLPPRHGERFLPRYSEQIVLPLFARGRQTADLNSLPVDPRGLLFIGAAWPKDLAIRRPGLLC